MSDLACNIPFPTSTLRKKLKLRRNKTYENKYVVLTRSTYYVCFCNHTCSQGSGVHSIDPPSKSQTQFQLYIRACILLSSSMFLPMGQIFLINNKKLKHHVIVLTWKTWFLFLCTRFESGLFTCCVSLPMVRHAPPMLRARRNPQIDFPDPKTIRCDFHKRLLSSSTGHCPTRSCEWPAKNNFHECFF